MEQTIGGRKYIERDGVLYCDRRNCPGSTGLRCQRSGVPICSKCAVRTPVGYISKDAAKQQADKYFNITPADYIIAGLVAFFATFGVGLMLVTFLGRFWILLLIASAPIGGGIGEMAWRCIRYKRGRHIGRAVGVAMVAATGILFLIGGFISLIFGLIATGAAVSRFEIALRA